VDGEAPVGGAAGLLDRVAIPPASRIPIVGAIYALGVALFLTLEPTRPVWLLLTTLVVGLGSDGIVRAYAGGSLRGALDTAPYLLVPAVFSLSAGFFLQETVSGYWKLLAAVVAGVMMGGVLYGECLSLDILSELYGTGRFILNIASYLAAFGLYAVMYSYGVGLVPAAICVGLLTTVLAAEILRETELMPPPVGRRSLRSLGFALTIGFVVAEARWALYFVPLEGFLAAVFLLLFFYVASGIAQHHLTGHLSRPVISEYGLVASVGLAMVILGRWLGGG
jgi:hypothetical protein